MTDKDILLTAMARCRLMTEGMWKEHFSEDLAVFHSCSKENLIEAHTKKEITFWELTDEGEKYIKENIEEVNECYRGFDIDQDISLLGFYSKLDEELKRSWVTKDDLIVKHRLPGTVDGVFINEKGETVGVKAVGNHANFSLIVRVESFLKETRIPQVIYLQYKRS